MLSLLNETHLAQASPHCPYMGNKGRRGSPQMGRKRTMCRTTEEPLDQISSVEAAKAFLHVGKGANVSALKMQKLVCVAHENHIAQTSMPFISDRVEAWKDGPVFEAHWLEAEASSNRRHHDQAPLPGNGRVGILVAISHLYRSHRFLRVMNLLR